MTNAKRKQARVEMAPTKCRVCGLMQTDYPVAKGYTMHMCRPCYNAQRRASYAANREHHNAKAVERYQNNLNGTKDKHHERMAARYAERGAQVREWFASLPAEKQKALGRAKQAKFRSALTDCYVRRLITTKTTDVPDALIQAKKLQIQIERLCNEKL